MTTASIAAQDRHWNIALIEDRLEFQKDVTEYLQQQTFEFGKIKVFPTADFEEAKGWLKDRKIDICVLDILRGDRLQNDRAGLDVLAEWRRTGFAPVVIYSAIADTDEIQKLQSPFVRIVVKESDGLKNLANSIRDLILTKVPEFRKLVNIHIERVLDEYMWSFVEKHWDSSFKEIAKQADFVHLFLSRLSQYISQEGIAELTQELYKVPIGGQLKEDKVHPARYYIKPPLSTARRLGDVCLNADGSYFVILWPSCDLAHSKVSKVLTAAALPLDRLPAPDIEPPESLTQSEFAKWKLDTTKSGPMRRLLQNQRTLGQPERYHYLPGVWDIPDLVIDFNELVHMPIAEVLGLTCIATVASPFSESLQARFVRFLSRIGTPDLDTDYVLNQLFQKLPAKAKP